MGRTRGWRRWLLGLGGLVLATAAVGAGPGQGLSMTPAAGPAPGGTAGDGLANAGWADAGGAEARPTGSGMASRGRPGATPGAAEATPTGAGAGEPGSTGAGTAPGGTESAPAPDSTPAPADPLIGAVAKAYRKRWPAPVKARGIYLSGYTAAQPAALQRLVDLVTRTELNALVIDVKDDSGLLTYRSALPEAEAAGAVAGWIPDLPGLLRDLHSRGIYTIARVVTFKDNRVARHRPEMAVHRADGGLWQDRKGMAWLDPYSRQAWDYVLAVAREAARMGFDEIQFDYVRFPTDGPMDQVVYPAQDGRSRAEVVAGFLAYAREQLQDEGVWVSADIFGIVLTAADDQGIGQQLEAVARGPDILSPMIYPSHYGPGNLGLPNPNAAPYETVHRALSRALERLGQSGARVRLRPWLQDFTLGRPPYGVQEVRAQIQAAQELGVDEWLLWNAANVYTEAALAPGEPDGPGVAAP